MDIVSTCISRDLPIYKICCERWRKLRPDATLHVITRKSDFGKFKDACGTDLELWDEDGLVPGMTISSLRLHSLSFFPAGAGWYFQQFLKWAFSSVSERDRYLIWDADTIPLRPFSLEDEDGRALLTTSSEYHPPYFATYRELFGEVAKPAPSFISQHQWVESSVIREITGILSHKSERGWAWTIIENLRGEGTNLFSEYETYGQFMMARHPESIRTVSREWTRAGRKLAGPLPSTEALDKLAKRFDFASFESNLGTRGRFIHLLRDLFRFYR